MYKGSIPWRKEVQTGIESPLDYPSWVSKDPGPVVNSYGFDYFWKPNEPFKDTLIVDSFSKGRSSANITAHSKTNGTIYSFFMSDFLIVMKNKSIIKGEIEESTWIFAKKGANYGLQLFTEV